jgi:hypothetical protein
MNLTRLEFECLDAAADDYEDIASFCRAVQREMGSVPRDAVISTIVGLVRRELLTPFRYDATLQQFIKLRDIEGTNPDELWYLISDAGLHVLNDYPIDE